MQRFARRCSALPTRASEAHPAGNRLHACKHRCHALSGGATLSDEHSPFLLMSRASTDSGGGPPRRMKRDACASPARCACMPAANADKALRK